MGAVLGLLDPLAAIAGQVLGAVGVTIAGILTGLLHWIPGVQEFMFDYIIEPIMKFLGFHDEDIYQVSIIAVRLFDDDLYTRTQLKLVTEYMKKESKDALWYATNFSQTGDAQFDKYYRFGKWYYLDYLPSIQITCTTVKETEVKAILRSLHNDSDVFIDEIGVMPPFDDDWCKWKLQEVFDYDVGNDFLALNDKYYTYGGSNYDANTGNFVVTLSAVPTVRETVVETTEATVIPRENDEIQRVVVTRTTTKYNADTGVKLNKVTTPVSSTDTVVVTGSGSTYTSETIISTNTITTGWTDTTTTIGYHGNIRRYVVKYSSMDTGRHYYWIYNTLDGTYPVLANPVNQIQGLEGYPICMLRNGFNDISNYNGSGQYGHSKPPTISQRRYEATRELMLSIGIQVEDIIDGYSSNPDIDKLQDCFYLYGISPSDSHWVVSRALYEMFDFIYDKMPYTGGTNDYSAAFKEDPYNAAVIWKASPTVIRVERIGGIGTCTHSISGATLTIKKQITATTTKTLTLVDTATFSIIRNSTDGYSSGEGLSIDDPDLVIPLPVEVVERLTLMEKTALLGRSAYLIFYSYQHQHIKWYQTSAFASFASTISTIISIAVAVVVTIVSFGNAAAGASAGTLVSTLMMGVLKSALIMGALQLALYIINETVQDTTLKMALTVIASLVAIAFSAGLGGGFNFGTAIQLAELPIKAAEIYMNDSMKKISDKMKSLQQETQSFSEQYQSRAKEFENKLKGMYSGLDVSSAVGLAVEVDNDYLMSSDRGYMLDPSTYFSMSTTACYNFDTLFTGFYDTCVHRFVRDRKTLGVLDTTGEE